MDHIDKQYINQIRSQLENFKWIQDKANFRCPLCGDSMKNKAKTRGWFIDHPQTRDVTIYKCFNCGEVTSLSNFIRTLNPTIYKEYCYEKYIKPKNNNIIIKQQVKKKTTDYISYSDFIKNPYINKDSDDYLINMRKFSKPQTEDFFYTNDFGRLLQTLPNSDKYESNFSNHYQKIVIPFFDDFRNVQLLQFRSINKHDKMRYITIRLNETFPKIWGLHRINKEKPVYVTEGPFDASFIKNSVAMGGADITTDMKNLIYIFDNEKRNLEIVKRMQKIVEHGHSIFIWPDVEEKDINDYYMVYGNSNVFEDKKRVFKGFKAKMEIDKWKRC